MSESNAFQKFPKIPRLNRNIIITEKIDGTNAQILIGEGGQVIAGSRSRYLVPGTSDNFGFAAWVKEHEDELRELGPGRHFGEWWGQGIQRNYGLDHRRFSLFNVSRWIDLSRDIDRINSLFSIELQQKRQVVPNCCYTVPVIWAGPNIWGLSVDVVALLRAGGSLAAPGFMKPEGIVVYHTAGNCLFKVTLENDEKPKGKNDARG